MNQTSKKIGLFVAIMVVSVVVSFGLSHIGSSHPPPARTGLCAQTEILEAVTRVVEDEADGSAMLASYVTPSHALLLIVLTAHEDEADPDSPIILDCLTTEMHFGGRREGAEDPFDLCPHFRQFHPLLLALPEEERDGAVELFLTNILPGALAERFDETVCNAAVYGDVEELDTPVAPTDTVSPGGPISI